MDRYAQGDNAAFNELYDELAPCLMSYLLRHMCDRARAEDLVQQTMLQVHRQRGRFICGSDVKPWAFTIARRYLIDSVRAESRRRAAMDGLSHYQQEAPAGTDEVVNSMQLAARLAEGMARLPIKQRMALEVMKHHSLSLREAAKILGTTTSALKLRLHRARAALRSVVDAIGAMEQRQAESSSEG